MSALPRGLRVVDGIAVLMVLAAAGIMIWPARVRVHATIAANETALLPGPRMSSAALDASSDTSHDAAIVVSANILSGSRKAPPSRYVSPDNVAPSTYVLPPAFQHDGNLVDSNILGGRANGDAVEDALPALYGIVSTDGTWRALVRLSTADAIPVLMREGDKRGAYHIVSIAADRVVVANGSGQHILRLSRANLRDSGGRPSSPRVAKPVQSVTPRSNL
jgi:hypothetical protein